MLHPQLVCAIRTDLATLERLLGRSPGGRRNGLVLYFLQVLRDLAVVFVSPPLLCADPARAALYVMNYMGPTRVLFDSMTHMESSSTRRR